jgi:hypothetical protein
VLKQLETNSKTDKKIRIVVSFILVFTTFAAITLVPYEKKLKVGFWNLLSESYLKTESLSLALIVLNNGFISTTMEKYTVFFTKLTYCRTNHIANQNTTPS